MSKKMLDFIDNTIGRAIDFVDDHQGTFFGLVILPLGLILTGAVMYGLLLANVWLLKNS